MRFKFFRILFLLLLLPISVLTILTVQRLILKAAYKPANIIIDTRNVLSPISANWANFAQGGEEPPPMLNAAIAKMQPLNPKYIRLDHIYDFYNVVKRESSGFRYDFSLLDKTVDDILAMGALPFFSLSYMPSEFTNSGSVIDAPIEWSWWQELVKETIEHFSGKNSKNLTNVYYEVWNEPELPQFGQWKISGSKKDYRLLYYYSVRGATLANNTNKFYIGGPAIGSFYPNWVNGLASYVSQNNLRMDFFSYHRYHKNSFIYKNDANGIRKILSSYPKLTHIPILLTEWGIESENSIINNSKTAAAFTISAILRFLDDINLSFAFEIKDGPPPAGGKWGLLTHERDNPSLSPKPRYEAFSALTQIKGEKLAISGEGTYVSAFASKHGNSINLILVNYDINNRNYENVPVTFSGLYPASYNITYTYYNPETNGKVELISTDGSLSHLFLMPANSIVSIELAPSGELATFIPGAGPNPNDNALVLKNLKQPVIYHSPSVRLQSEGSISFDLKPIWNETNLAPFIIFEAPFYSDSGSLNKMYLAVARTWDETNMTFNVTDQSSLTYSVSQAIGGWNNESWHHITASWNNNSLTLSVDGELISKEYNEIHLKEANYLTIYPIEAALDNLKILSGPTFIRRQFNDSVDR